MKIFSILATLFITLILVASAECAQKPFEKVAPAPKDAAAKAGDQIKTEYFNFKLPNGWLMPYPITKRPGGISTVFVDEKTEVTVTVNIIKVNYKPREFAANVLPGMRESGLRTGKGKEINGMYMVPLEGKANGQVWFASTGQVGSATIIFASPEKIKNANELLNVITTTPPKLLPKNI